MQLLRVNRSYRNFAVIVLIIGVLLALFGGAVLHTFSLTSWDRIFPPGSPQLTNPDFIALRESMVRELSKLPVTVGIVLIVLGAFNWWRARKDSSA
jgi:hypothetical protein